ncbi:timeless-domain-containing protein [Rhizodiscina lignyota]|uniref:Topoisomerase 1-associated factor 1 n=1 Tax=Rhizodiscina lignyota TaxID=1504668 RepID=A0A9P4IGI0_9PEZI|nr:timeless-domain-containing protein [Rhizodiscina lignyota]
MNIDEWVQPTVHPEVRAHVNSLVSALGGSSAEYDGRYVLGDDALACLKDIKRWLKLHDDSYNRHDVARALAEADLVCKDLLEILASWPETDEGQGMRYKIAAACLELLVPLTWPVQKDDTKMTVHNHKHMPYLQLAQVKYKRAILQHDSERILRTIVRIGLPAMAEARNERSPRDEGIIRIVLFALRNIAMIEQPRNLPVDGDESDISRSTLIEAFHTQDIFQLLLTIASSMGEEFDVQDVLILEILFHVLKGIDPEKLFMEEKHLASANTDELKGLIQKEKSMLSGYARHAPSRHNRFGTMVWVKRGDDRVSTVSGQDFLGNDQRSLVHMDKSKKWNRPKYRGKRPEEAPTDEFDVSIPLSQRARNHLRSFVEDFLDSSFNPLFGYLRKTIEREADRVIAANTMQYFYLISWFLKAECARRKATKNKKGSRAANVEDESFALIASALTQSAFVLLNRFMQRSQDDKNWNDLNAGMKCFTQILLTIQEMADSPLEDDQDIAENIQNRIFYEETTHDRIITILRSYKDQGFGYLDACTEMAHVFLRMLERYSKQNVDLQIRSRRRARRKQKATDGTEGEGNAAAEDQEDLHEAQRTVSERKFDFHRFAAKFTTQQCINTFVALTTYYNDLSAEQLKRAHRYFHRVAFKMEIPISLYRVDILHLFYKMIKGPGGLDPDSPSFKEWEELIRHLFRQAIKKVQERPELIVEMLFSKINATMFYLEHGYDKEVVKRPPRPPADLEVKPGLALKDQIAVVVTVLVLEAKFDLLGWLKGVLGSAAEERKAWEDSETRKVTQENSNEDRETAGSGELQASNGVDKATAPSILAKPDDDDIKKAMFKNNKLRLLMTLVGFMRLGVEDDADASWIIPSNITSDALKESRQWIEHAEFHGLGFDLEEGKSAEDYLRRKRKVEYDDDTEGSSGDDFLFAAGGPTARKPDGEDGTDDAPKRRRRLQRRDEELDDEEKERRRKAREETQKENLRKIKSTLYVDSDDEEDDDERDKDFFAKEEQIRKATRENILKALSEAQVNSKATKKRKSTDGAKGNRKRKKVSLEDDIEGSASDTDASDDDDLIGSRVARRSSPAEASIDNDDSDAEMTDTPLSSPHANATNQEPQTKPVETRPADTSSTFAQQTVTEGDNDEDDVLVRTQRRTVRAGFIIDSDSE